MRIIQLRAPESLLVTIANRGPAGRDGKDGKSIVGPKGDPGQSITGPAGKDGQSITGPRGLQGVPGRDGVSIKGDKGDPGETIVGPAGRDGVSITGAAGRDGTTMLPIRPFVGSLIALNGFAVTPSPAAIQGQQDQMDLYPFVPGYSLTIDQMLITTTGPATGSSVKIVIYDADADGLPSNLLLESAERMTVATGVDQPVTASFSFTAGRLYWVGVRYSALISIRAISAVNCQHFARSGTTYYNSFRRTVAYSDPAPAMFNPVASEMVSAALPVICGRRA